LIGFSASRVTISSQLQTIQSLCVFVGGRKIILKRCLKMATRLLSVSHSYSPCRSTLYCVSVPVAPSRSIGHPRNVSFHFSFLLIIRTPWTGDQPNAGPLPTQDNTNRINANIHTLNEIRSHYLSVRAGEDISCHCDRLVLRMKLANCRYMNQETSIKKLRMSDIQGQLNVYQP
jgi:hypothetical protein